VAGRVEERCFQLWASASIAPMTIFAKLAAGLLQGEGNMIREPLELLAAFASEAYTEGRERRVAYTPFCFITGSGHQFFLDTVRQLMKKATAERIRSIPYERASSRMPLDDERNCRPPDGGQFITSMIFSEMRRCRPMPN
jgi:hypothetical protein